MTWPLAVEQLATQYQERARLEAEYRELRRWLFPMENAVVLRIVDRMLPVRWPFAGTWGARKPS